VAEWQTQRTQKQAKPEGSDAAPRESAPFASERPRGDAELSAVLPRNAAAKEPSDDDLERGILDALARGLDGVAKSLSSRLDERRQARLPANVHPIERARSRGKG
jgi:hypothetical protein